MSQQNIYDNETFFEGYKKLRENEVNANNLFEIPILFLLDLPNTSRKNIIIRYNPSISQFWAVNDA